MNFEQKYIEILNPVKNEIEKVSEELNLHLDIQEPLKTNLLEFLNAPSKHIRALLSFLYIKANGQEITDNQIKLQAAIELVHNASLIHDDIIDESILRRGIETINSNFDNKLAVITGDYLLSKALHKILTLNNIKIIKVFTETLENMCQGEIKQQFDKYKITTIEEYIKKSEQKTAKLFETAIICSTILSEKPENNSEFAKNFGIAFQIHNDILNIKNNKSDIKEGIYTAPVIYSEDIENPEKGIEKTIYLLNNYIEKALKEIEHIKDNIYKTKLIELLELIKNA